MWWRLSSLDHWFDMVGLSMDPRIRHLLWFNVSPVVVMWAIINFVLVTQVFGPEMMRDLEPFNIRWFMLFYNCFMALANMYAVWKVIPLSNYFRILWNFDYPDRSDMSAASLYLIHLGYLYWLSKLMDLWDTMFFLMRKKFTHLTFLHIYHHTVVPMFGYILMRVNPLLPCVFLFSFVNSIVHVIMYSYYALAALGPWIQPYLWWKKYITILQLWQFVLYGLYGCLILMWSRGYPPFWMYVGFSQPPLFFWMFFDFYLKAYTKRHDQNLAQFLWRKWTSKSDDKRHHIKSH